jgi:hypothetical protein
MELHLLAHHFECLMLWRSFPLRVSSKHESDDTFDGPTAKKESTLRLSKFAIPQMRFVSLTVKMIPVAEYKAQHREPDPKSLHMLLSCCC